jgi:hypothetical protein
MMAMADISTPAILFIQIIKVKMIFFICKEEEKLCSFYKVACDQVISQPVILNIWC